MANGVIRTQRFVESGKVADLGRGGKKEDLDQIMTGLFSLSVFSEGFSPLLSEEEVEANPKTTLQFTCS